MLLWSTAQYLLTLTFEFRTHGWTDFIACCWKGWPWFLSLSQLCSPCHLYDASVKWLRLIIQTANCLWLFLGGGEGLVPLVVGFGGEVARCPFSPFLTVYCLNDPALEYSCLDSSLALPRHEVWALAVPEEETHSLVRGQGVSLYFDIFTQLSYSEFCCPKAMRDRCPVGACLFLLLKRQSERQSSEKLCLLLVCCWRGW